MKRATIVSTLVLTAALLGGASASARPGPPAPPPGPPHHGPPPAWTIHQHPAVKAYLQLTPQQVAALKRLARSSRGALEQLHRQLRAQHQALTRAFAVHPPDRRAATIHAAAIGRLLARQVTLDVEARLKVHHLLDSEQAARLARLARRARPPRHTGPPPPDPASGLSQ